MKLCFVCCEYPPARHGGIGSVTQVLARAFAESGHEVRVLGLYTRLDAPEHVENDRGVAVWRIPMPPGRLGWTQGRRQLFDTVSRWVEHGEVDLVEVPDWEGYAACWPHLQAPVVTRLHGSSSYFAREMRMRIHWPAYCLEAASFHRVDYCCSTSGYTATRTQHLFGHRLRPVDVLFNPVDVPPEPAAQRSTSRVVFAGTLTAKKGEAPLVEAWPAVLEGCPSAELHLFGKDAGTEDGRPMIDILTGLLPEHARESVHFHGHVERERVQNEFASCRLAVFPSFAEAFSMVPLEAMAHGCPVIYSNRCSGPELIDSGCDGLLIDPSRPEQIAEAIVSLLRDDAACARMGAAGRNTIRQRFSTDILLARNERFYSDCISRHA